MSGTSGRRRHRPNGRARISTGQRPLIEADVAALPVVTLKTPTPHPNIFRKRIQDIPGDVQPGSCVAVRLPDDSHFGYGYCNSQSSIALRMISTQSDPPDVAYWDRLLERAVRLRTETLKLDEVTNACRLVNGEGDFLPGLVIDRYDDVLSVEAYSLAMFRRAEAIAERLANIVGTRHTIIRTSPSSETHEGFDADPLTSNELPSELHSKVVTRPASSAINATTDTGWHWNARGNRCSICVRTRVALLSRR